MKKIFTAALAAIALTASPSTPARLLTASAQDATVTRPDAPQRVRIDNLEGRNLQLLCREDFSLFTAGSEETPDSKDLCEGMYAVGYPVPIPDELMSTPGWTGAGVYQAGGMAALAIPRMGGLINTPPGDFGGKIIIKLRVRSLKGNAVIMCNLCRGDEKAPSMAVPEDPNSISIKEEQGWVELIYESVNRYAGEKTFVQFNAMNYNPGALLVDDIEIYRDLDFVWAPKGITSGRFTQEGFTTTWDKIETADSYLVTLLEETVSGTEDYTESRDFNSIDASGDAFKPSDTPEGWEITLTGDKTATADGGMDDSPAIIVSEDGDCITFPVTGGRYRDLRFWLRSVDRWQFSSGEIEIQGLTPDRRWVTFGRIDLSQLTATGNYDLAQIDAENPLFSFTDLYCGVRLLCCDMADMSVAIDDVYLRTSAPTVQSPVVEDYEVTTNGITFADLLEDAEYYVMVKAKKGNYISEPSDLHHAFGLPAPAAVAVGNLDSEGNLTASWRKHPRATSYEVRLYGVDRIAADNSGWEALNQDFAYVSTDATVENPASLGNKEYTDLEGLIGQPGWIGRNTLYANGMVGGKNASSDLLTPPLTLNHGDGNYKVRLRAWSVQGESLVVQGVGVYDMYEFPEAGFREFEIELGKGTMQNRLMMYTLHGSPFLVDDITVTQAVRADDPVYSILDYKETPEATMPMKIENPEGEYALTVTAIQNWFGEKAYSEISTPALFSFAGVGIEETLADARVAMQGNTLTAAADAIVYNLSGIRVASLTAGESVVLPAGIYVVVCDGKAFKLISK